MQASRQTRNNLGDTAMSMNPAGGNEMSKVGTAGGSITLDVDK
jgi:hypothetical protein